MSLLFSAEGLSPARSRSPPFSSARWAARSARATATAVQTATAAWAVATTTVVQTATAAIEVATTVVHEATAASEVAATTVVHEATAASEVATTVVQTATAASEVATTTVVQIATAASEVVMTTVVQIATAASAVATPWTGPHEPWNGRRRNPSQYEIGYREGYSVRNPSDLFRPPASVVALLLGHTSWVFGMTEPGSEEHEVSRMARDWLLDFE